MKEECLCPAWSCPDHGVGWWTLFESRCICRASYRKYPDCLNACCLQSPYLALGVACFCEWYRSHPSYTLCDVFQVSDWVFFHIYSYFLITALCCRRMAMKIILIRDYPPSRVGTVTKHCQLREDGGGIELFLCPSFPAFLQQCTDCCSLIASLTPDNRTTPCLQPYRTLTLLAGQVLMLQVDSLLWGRRKIPHLNK